MEKRMKSFLGHTLHRMARWLGKGVPAALTGGAWSGPGMVDAFRRRGGSVTVPAVGSPPFAAGPLGQGLGGALGEGGGLALG